MKNPAIPITLCMLVLFTTLIQAGPIALHPENPHYFIYNGGPTLLITSAEHYGAVLNADFDYIRYLRTLKNEGMNYTRIFTGSYVEIENSFGIEHNTLAPGLDRFLPPWQRVNSVGLYNGEKKFDLYQWNPEYFTRLKNCIAMADELDIIVEVTLFCSTYNDDAWQRHPFNPGNNINGLSPDLDRKKSNTLENGKLTDIQKALVVKIVTELNEYDNVIYEIQNEPWADAPRKAMRTLRTMDPGPGQGGWSKWAERASNASLAWQQFMTQVITDTEKELPKQHLIAQNYTNFKAAITEVDSNVSIMNFHYAWPEAVWLNHGWYRPVSFDESGFDGSSDTTYLRQAWQFILAGGAVFNSLDYSFYVGKETGVGMNTAPGGGSATLRKQLGYLHAFMDSLNYINMSPEFSVVRHAPGLEWQALSEPGKQYGIILHGLEPAGRIELDLPKGKYRYVFVSPFTGAELGRGEFKQKKGRPTRLELPQFDRLLGMRIVKD